MRFQTTILFCGVGASLLLASATFAAATKEKHRSTKLSETVSTSTENASPPKIEAHTQTADVKEIVTNSYAQFHRAFNPNIGVTLQGFAAYMQGENGSRNIPGSLSAQGTGRGPEGISLGESELIFSANIDDQLYGFFDLSFDQSEIEIEEGYISTTALPAGFSLKAGQFLSAIGYQNDRHSHNWDFVDQPLVYDAMLGGGLSQPGVQVSWLAPIDLYLEIGGEILRGDEFPAAGSANHGFGLGTVYVKLSGDLDESRTWKLGLAYLRAKSNGRVSAARNGNSLSLDGSTDLFIGDFIWKWAPNGNFRERNFTFQAEYMHRRERGSLRDEITMSTGRYRGHQDGFYVQGIYQFIPRWRVGLRYGQLWSDDFVSGIPASLLAGQDSSPRRVSAMFDFSNSEFSRLRLQYSHEFGGLGNDSLVFLQYIISFGTHGAHTF